MITDCGKAAVLKASNVNPRQLERVETEYKIYKIVAADLRDALVVR